MTESPFSWTSGGTPAGQLTIRANTWDEMTDKLAEVAADPQHYLESTGLALAAFKAVGLVHAAAPVAAAPPAAPAAVAPAAPTYAPPAVVAPVLPQPVAAAPPAGVHLCDHGEQMTLKNSNFGSFYACPRPWKINGVVNPERCNKKVNV